MPKKISLIIILAIILAGLYLKPNNTNQTLISGVVVPHHNLVADLRTQFFSELATKITPKTIILLSPNHYQTGQGKIQTTDQIWNLEEGKIIPNSEVISTLIRHGLVSNEPTSFTNEHGIYNILSDIKNNFPQAQIVPLIFEKIPLEQLAALESELIKDCPDCLMIASVDFSHYQPALLADLHDDLSIRDLENIDVDKLLTEPEVDSGPALTLLAMWAQDHHTLHFSLQNHTGSGVIYHDPDLESTTHVFGWYQSGTKVEPEQEVSFIIGGDVMFGRYINHLFQNDFNQVFEMLGDRVFWGTDAAIVNLEGAITNEPIQDNIQTDNLNFRFSPNIVKTLEFLHLNAVSLANNHSNNAGVEGINTTRTLLGENGIQAFGGATESSVIRVASFTGQGLKLTLIGINLTFPGQTPDPIVPMIKKLKEDPKMRVIVMPHWGLEYQLAHSPAQSAAAHQWIDAGADLVIGSHPHVIQDAEIYRGVPIIYSLGNLLFDQNQPNTTEGLLITGKFTSEGLSFLGLPVQSIHFKPELIKGAEKQKILTSLYTPFINHLVHSPAGDIIRILK